MNEYRLDDLIREGIEITGFRKFSLLSSGNACAMGAAQVSLLNKKGKEIPDTMYVLEDEFNSLPHISINHLPEVEGDEVVRYINEFEEDSYIDIVSAVASLNDSKALTRKAIAEWVGWLIDQKGYDFTLSIDDEDDNEEEEEKEEKELQPA